MSNCLSDEQIERYCTSRCDADGVTICERHLATCLRCRQRVEAARANEHFLVGLKRIMSTSHTSALADTPQGDGHSSGSVISASARVFTRAARHERAVCPLIPGYRIYGELHRGGQGMVFHALQESTRREVAIKVLRRTAFSNRRDAERFRREVEILAQLRHPGIVTIHDSGTVDHQAYFVMDYVAGHRLDDYVAESRPASRAVLELFAKVCDAVNAAHLRGVLHRDLKPSNIIVDGQGEPRVLDFGLAKALAEQSDASADEGMTLTGQFFGSLPWASPEQAAADPRKLDIRSDVYSLGVILYQLLTGHLPHDVSGPTRTVLDRLQNAPPAPPRSFLPQLAPEVETILLKCLSKDPERRYQSAGELARDLRRYLAHEPIEAKRDSTFYVIRKNLWRYRVATGVGLAFVALLIVALLAVTLQWRRTQDALEIARMMNERTATEHADLRAHLQNLAALDDFVESNTGNTHLADVYRRVADERAALAEKIERHLALHDFEPLVAVLAHDPLAPAGIAALVESPEHVDLQARLGRKLGRWLRFPYPAGFLQGMLDCETALLKLDPNNRQLAEMQGKRDEHWQSLQILYERDFRTLPAGAPLPGWTLSLAEDQGVPLLADGAALTVAATDSSMNRAGFEVADPGGYVEVRCTLEVQKLDARLAADSACSIMLDVDGGIVCWRADADALRELTERGRPIEVRLLCYPADGKRRLAVIADGYVIRDDVQLAPNGIQKISFAATRAVLRLTNISVRSTADESAIAQLGPYLPLVELDQLGLMPAYHLSISADTMMTHDLSGDGCAELIAPAARGTLRIYSGHADGSLRRAITLPGEMLVRPCGLVGDYLTVFPIGASPSRTELFAESAIPEGVHLGLLPLSPELSTDLILLSRSYPGVDRGTAVPVENRHDAPGFVFGTRHYRRSLESFRAAPTGAAEPFVSMGEWQLHRRDDGTLGVRTEIAEDGAGDVMSLAAHDYDGDGDDDLFVGWGHWHGECAALVVMDDGQPQSAYTISPRVGETLVAVVDLGAWGPCLVAAAREEHSAGTDLPGGLRIWRLRDLQAETSPPPAWSIPAGSFVAVTGGELAGQKVFATAQVAPALADEPAAASTISVRVFGLGSANRIVELHRYAIHHPTRSSDLTLHLADLDGDGANELLLQRYKAGVLVTKGLAVSKE